MADGKFKLTNGFEIPTKEAALLKQSTQVLVAGEDRFTYGVTGCQELGGIGKHFSSVLEDVIGCLTTTVHHHTCGHQGGDEQQQAIGPPRRRFLLLSEVVLESEPFAAGVLEVLEAAGRQTRVVDDDVHPHAAPRVHIPVRRVGTEFELNAAVFSGLSVLCRELRLVLIVNEDEHFNAIQSGSGIIGNDGNRGHDVFLLIFNDVGG